MNYSLVYCSRINLCKFQLLPDQAANLMNLTSRLSIPSAKSPKASYGFHLPGYESYPENNSSIKM